VPFASALSEHPITALATGEVAGAVLEAIGPYPDFVVITVTRSHAGALEDIVSTISAVLQPLAVLGCAAESVVGVGREVEETPAISVWAGRVGPLAQIAMVATRLADDTWHFGGWPEPLSFEPTTLVLLADPFTFPIDAFVEWVDEKRPGLNVVGGNVSGGRGPGGNRLVIGDRVLSSGAVGVLIGAGVDIETVVSQGCRPYGQALTVTKADRNIIFEVAGQPALECMVEQIKSGLGPGEIAGIESSGLFVGRLVDDYVDEPGNGDYLVRSVVGIDRTTGAVAVDEHVALGSTIRFHLRDESSAHDELIGLLATRSADGVLAFTCNGRGTRLFDVADHDARTLEHTVGPIPLGGLFAAGEIGPIGGKNFVHNFTASMALFRDR
jgi:small ligand-binding sensory domain FIST